VTKYGTRVPSFDVAKCCVVSYWLTSTGALGASKGVLRFVPMS
jgi:hypothetical protein